MAFELQALRVSGSPIDVDFFRVHLDESVSPAVVTSVGSFTDLGVNDNVRWTLKGDLGGSNEIAVSMKWNGQTTGTGLMTCVDPASYSASGNTSTCGGFTAPDVSDFDSLMNQTHTDLSGKDEDEYKTAFSSADSVDFDASNIADQPAVY